MSVSSYTPECMEGIFSEIYLDWRKLDVEA
jgi:hypothetical protein